MLCVALYRHSYHKCTHKISIQISIIAGSVIILSSNFYVLCTYINYLSFPPINCSDIKLDRVSNNNCVRCCVFGMFIVNLNKRFKKRFLI